MLASLKRLSLLLALVMALPMASQATGTTPAPALCPTAAPTVEQVDQILEDMKWGNLLYSLGLPPSIADVNPKVRACMSVNPPGQNPKGVILSCIDSRVPPELVFRFGLGEFFVTRVAGNVPLVGEIASIEYAVEHLKVPLVYVLGHTSCGAVNAAADVFNARMNHAGLTESLTVLVDKIMPAVQASATSLDPPVANKAAAYHVNAALAAEDLLKESEAVAKAACLKEIRVVVGVYDLATGRVTVENPDVRPAETRCEEVLKAAP